MNKKNVGIFIFESVEILDFTGPYEVFSSVRLTEKSLASIQNLPCPFDVFTISEKNKNIKTTGGMTVKSDFNFKNCPKLNVLIIPGGVGTRALLKNENVLDWIKNKNNTEILCSICTGSLLLGKAGLLKNKKATTHWGAFNLLKKITPTTEIVKNKKFVHDTIYTSAGVSSGIDMSLHIIKVLYGDVIAKNTARYIEYNY